MTSGTFVMVSRAMGMGLGSLLMLGFLAACSVAPEPLTIAKREIRATADLEMIQSKRYVPVESISLYDAMARAVAFNLQHSVRQIERDIAELELEQANQEGLPDISASGGGTRDSVKISTDTDRNIRTGSFGATWSLLDLGVSYARAKQSADRVMIAEERQRKGLQDIIRSVRLAYWKAVGAQQLMARMVAIEHDFSKALAESRRLEITNVETRRRTVSFRHGLIDTVRQLIAARKEYGRAKLEFAQLINVRPGVKFTLKLPETEQGIPALPMPIAEMEAFALDNRPELRVEDYNERISEWESREALYGMFPGLDLDLARNFSSDSGLANGAWTGVGATLGMNLFRVFSGALSMDTAAMRGEMARRQRLAMSVAVLAQVYIASQEYREANYQFRLARQISHSDNELSKLAVAERRITNGNMLDVVDVAARQLRSEVDQHRAYVELRRSHGDVLHALGLDAIPPDIPLDNVKALRVAIRNTMAKWETLAEDTDPANDGSIEDLVGKVLADMDGVLPTGPGPMIVADVDQPTLAAATAPIFAEPELVAEMLADVNAAKAGTPLTVASKDQSLEMELEMAPKTRSETPAKTPPETPSAMIGEEAGKTPSDTAVPVDARFEVVADMPLPDGLAPDGVAPVDMAANSRHQVAPPAPARTHAPLNYDVQFGAFKELARAEGLLAALKDGRGLPNTVDAARRFQIVGKEGAGDQVLFHVQLGAYPGRGAAKNDCAAFMTRGQKCVVVRRAGINRQGPAASMAVVIDGALEELAAIRASAGAIAAGEPMPALAARGEPASRRGIVPATPNNKRTPPNYDVQFGAFNELQRARDLLATLEDGHRSPSPADVARRFQIVGKAGAGDQKLFHVQFGAYRGRSAARSDCDVFLARGHKCVVVRQAAVKQESLAGSMDAVSAGTVLAKRVLEASDEAFDDVSPRRGPRPAAADAGELMLATAARAELDPRQPIVPPLPRQKRILPNYDVQFGAFNELPRAQGLLAELQNRRRSFGSIGAERRFHIVKKENPDKQVLFHVQFGAYIGWTAARIACDGFARRGKNCVVVRQRLALAKETNVLTASNTATNPL